MTSAVAVVLMASCVAADAGYSDVRDLTADRLRKDVRWYEHDSLGSGEAATKKLLAEPLEVDAAVQLALLNNQGLQADFEELGVARARVVEAIRLPNPTADVAFRHVLGEADDPSIDLDVLIDITDLLFLPLKSSAAGASLEAARLSVTGRVFDRAYQTRVAFYAYQAAEQTLEFRRTILSALGASFEITQRLHRAGNVTDLTLANDRALYEEARVSLTDAEANVTARREELNAQMGLWGPRAASWKLRGGLEPPPDDARDVQELESRALERSIDLELSRKRFTAAAKTANLRRAAGWIPELSVGVSAEREASEGEWAAGPAFAIEVPLFYQGQGEAGVALAEARREQRAYADTAIRIRSAARSAVARMQASAKSAAYYRDVLLPLRQRIVDETQLQYNAMSVGAFQLLQAKRDQIEAARSYVELLRNYWTARAEVDQLSMGRLPLGGGLTQTDAGNSSGAQPPPGGGH